MIALQKYNLSGRWWLVILLLAGSTMAMAQVGRPPMLGGGQSGTEQVQLIHADSLNVLNSPGMSVRRVVNNVKFSHNGALLYCDLAIQNTTNNVIEAYGHVRIVQGDTVTVQGDTMYYYGNTRNATVLHRVVLKDRKMTLTTARLDYDMANGLAHYPTKGRIVDKENVLTSEEGYYNTRSKEFTFIKNVRLVNPQTTLVADSLLYNSLTKIATFQGPTKIVNKDGTLQARDGTYNTTSRVSNFKQRATAFTDKYTLTGDTLTFDNQTELGIAKGHVVLVAKEDKTTITGNQGRYNGKLGITRVTGNAVVRSVTGKDTLYMRADTLFSYDTPSGSKVKTPRKLIGQRNVLVFKPDMQSRCDSLVYTAADSSFYFYKKPIVWSEKYQMEADTITARLVNNRIRTLLLRSRSFVVSQDTMKFFNQIKGRSITANFKQVKDTLRPKVVRLVRRQPGGGAVAKTAGTSAGKKSVPASSPPVVMTALVGAGTGGKPPKVEEKTQLDKVTVEGNGQSIYFVVDDKNVFTGMNRVDCSKMTLEFTNSRVGNIWFYGHPDGILTPPKQLTEEKQKLDGFRWRANEKPTKANVLGETPYGTPMPKTSPPPAPAQIIADLSDRVPAVKSVTSLPASFTSASINQVRKVITQATSVSGLASLTTAAVNTVTAAAGLVAVAPAAVSAAKAAMPAAVTAVTARRLTPTASKAAMPAVVSAVAAKPPKQVASMSIPTVVLLPDTVMADTMMVDSDAMEQLAIEREQVPASTAKPDSMLSVEPAGVLPKAIAPAPATPISVAPVSAVTPAPVAVTPTLVVVKPASVVVKPAPVIVTPVPVVAPPVPIVVKAAPTPVVVKAAPVVVKPVAVAPVVPAPVLPVSVAPTAAAPVAVAPPAPAPVSAVTKSATATAAVANSVVSASVVSTSAAAVSTVPINKANINTQRPASVGAGSPNVPASASQATLPARGDSDLEKVLNKAPLNKNGIKLDVINKPFAPKSSQKQ